MSSVCWHPSALSAAATATLGVSLVMASAVPVRAQYLLPDDYNGGINLQTTAPTSDWRNPGLVNVTGTISTNSYPALQGTGAWTISNSGTISSTNSSGNYPINTGVYLDGANATVINFSLINGSGRSAINFQQTGAVTNFGTITGGTSITGASGIYLNAGGTVTNGSLTNRSAFIGAVGSTNHGVEVKAGAGTIVNYGTIQSGTGGDAAITLLAGGTVTNYGSLVGGTGAAVKFGSSGGTLKLETGSTETGSLVGGGNGVLVLEGTNSLSNTASGFSTLTMSGTDWTLAGSVTATSAEVRSGVLRVSGSGTLNASGGVQVDNGATLAGTGAVAGNVTTQSGGTLLPGSAGTAGTLTLSGNLVQQSGATLLLETTTTAASVITVSGGTATLGGALRVDSAAGTYNNKTFVILTATGGITGTFSSIMDTLAGITPTVTYDTANNRVILVLNSAAPSPPPSTPAWGTGDNVLTFTNNVTTAQDGLTGDDTMVVTGAVAVSADVSNVEHLLVGTSGGTTTSASFTSGTQGFVDTTVYGNAVLTAAGAGLTPGTLTLAGGTLAASSNFTQTGAVVLQTDSTASAAASATLTLSGVVSGNGGLTVSGPGTVVLSGANTYTGGTNVTSGTLVLGNGLALGTGGLTLEGGTTLAFVNSLTLTNAVKFASAGDPIIDTGTSTVTLAGAISGPGDLTKAGSGTLILTGADTYTGGTTVAAGTLQLGNGGTTGSITGDITDNSRLAFNRSDAVTFAGAISGTGTLVQMGPGTLTLTGTSTVSGPTTVAAGTLIVDGSLGNSAVTVAGGASLGGTGLLGSLAAQTGAVVAPGLATPFSTLQVAGNASFASGSTLQVRTNAAGQNDALSVGGTATLSGGTVAVLAQAGTYKARTAYRILTAAGGVSGQFATVTSNLAFLTPTLSYGTDDVLLTLARNDLRYAAVGATPNQRRIGAGLDVTAAGTPGPASQTVLTALDAMAAPQAQTALDRLGGEGFTATQNAAFQATGSFLAAIGDEQNAWRTPDRAAAPFGLTLTAPLPAGANSYADTTLPAFPPLTGGATAAPLRQWRVWGGASGGEADLAGSATLGAAAQTATFWGGQFGVDHQVTPDWLVGVAVGGSQSNFDVWKRATSGSVTGAHGGPYSTYTFANQTYAQAALLFSGFDNTTRRVAGGFGGLGSQTLNGSFGSFEVRVRGEVGRRFDLAHAGITPFAAVEYANLRSDGFTETAGPGTAAALALRVRGQTTESLPVFAGVRLDSLYALSHGMTVRPYLTLAYIHEFDPARTLVNSLVSLPGASFLVEGARPASNAAQVKAGAELSLGAAASLFATFDSELSGPQTVYAGRGGLKASF